MPPERMVAIARRVAEAELGTRAAAAPEVKPGDAAGAVVA